MTETIQHIKNIVDIFGMTHKELAKKAGFTEATVCRWMQGSRNPSIANVEKMLDVLGMEIKIHKK